MIRPEPCLPPEEVSAGYATAFAAGESMTARQLEQLGCNHSFIHTDVMFGSAEVTIVATQSREGEVVLIDRGDWTKRFLAD